MADCNITNKLHFTGAKNDFTIINTIVKSALRRNESDQIWKDKIKDKWLEADQIISAIEDNGGASLPESFVVTDKLQKQTTSVLEKNEKLFESSNEEKTSINFVPENTTELEYCREFGLDSYKELIQEFSNRMVESTFFRVKEDNGKFTTEKVNKDREMTFDRNSRNKVNFLNYEIYKYKLELLRDIQKVTLDTESIPSDNISEILDYIPFTRLIQRVTSNFWTNINSYRNNSNEFRKAYKAFVILNNFNSLVEKNIDFLSDNLPKGYHSVSQYQFLEPKAPQLNNWSDESADIQKTTSKLQKIILNYLHPINTVDGEETLNKKVTLGGGSGVFEFAISSFKKWLLSGENNSYDGKVYKENFLDRDFSSLYEAFDKYIDYLNSTAKDPKNNYIKSVIKSIKAFILDPKSAMPLHIKNMFINQIAKTTKQYYIAYQIKNGQGRSIDLQELLVSTQSLSLQNSFQSTYSNFRENPSDYIEFKTRWGIKKDPLTGNWIIPGAQNGFIDDIIMNIKPSKNSEGKYSPNISIKRNIETNELTKENIYQDNEAAVRFINDLFQISILDGYNDIVSGINFDNKKSTGLIINHLFDPCLLLFQFMEYGKSDDNIPDSAFYDRENNIIKTYKFSYAFRNLTDFLSAQYGTDYFTVLKNQEGNNLPANGLQILGAQPKEMIQRIEKDKRNANLLAKNPIAILLNANTGAVKPVAIRTDNKVNNSSIKPSKKWTIPELGYVEIMDDFLGNLYKQDRVQAERNSDLPEYSGNILIQFTTTADKTTHYILPINLDKVQFLYDNGEKEVNGLELFRNICEQTKNGNKYVSVIKDQIFSYYQDRYSKIATEIVNSYKKALPRINAIPGIPQLKLESNNLLSNLLEIDNFIKEFSKRDSKDWIFKLSDAFSKSKDSEEDLTGEDFVENLHYSKLSTYDKKLGTAKFGLNEVLLNKVKEFSDIKNPDIFNKKIAFSLAQSVLQLEKNDVQFPLKTMTGILKLIGRTSLQGSEESIKSEKIFKEFINSLTGNMDYYILKRKGSENHLNIEGINLLDINSYKFKDSYTIEFSDGKDNYELKINPVLIGYYYATLLFGNSYKELLLADGFNHPTTYKASKDEKLNELNNKEQSLLFYIKNESARENAGFKRAVPIGATVHPGLFATNANKFGAKRIINYACIEDVLGNTWNLKGQTEDSLETMDGSGLSSPYESRLENMSALDASVGVDKKTIFADINPRFGNPVLLKWAVDSITNENRRNSWGSKISLENVFRKMHNIPISINHSMTDSHIMKYYQPNKRVAFPDATGYKNLTYNNYIYYMDPETGKHYKILKVNNDKNSFKKWVQEVDSNGNILNKDSEPLLITREIGTLYDIDQFFGGAWCEKLNEDRLEFTEDNIEIISNYICANDLQDGFIGYLVNKSAVKVGRTNINRSSSWYDDTPFNFSRMSLQFGGIQMDPDHTLDMSQVTEMSQMISALNQNGNNTELVKEIYTDIGKVALSGIKDLKDSLNSGDSEKIYRLMGKALMDSLSRDSNVRLGLAESFMVKAAQYLDKENIKFYIPFSHGNVLKKVFATIVSNINKSGIKRKYTGIAAYLSPSHDMIQYYRLGNNTYLYPDLINYLEKYKENHPSFKGTLHQIIHKESWKDPLTDDIIYNPFIKKCSPLDVEIEDTIIIKEHVNVEGVPTIKTSTIKMDNYLDYDKVRNRLNKDTTEIFKWTIKPKNLRQADFYFDVEGVLDSQGNTKKHFSMYDLDSVRLCHYLNAYIEKNKGETIPEFFKKELQILETDKIYIALEKALNNNKSAEDLLKYFQKKQQEDLIQISQGNINWNSCFGIEYIETPLKVLNTNFQAPEVIMGCLYAKELGLKNSDTLSEIRNKKSKFFEEKLTNEYALPESQIINPLSYDLVINNPNNKKILVVIGDPDNVSDRFDPEQGKIYKSSTHIKTDEGWFVGNNLICKDPDNEVSFSEFVPATGESIEVITIKSIEKLDDVLSSGYYSDDISYNYQENNWKDLIYNQNKYLLSKVDNSYSVKTGRIVSMRVNKDIEIDFNETLDYPEITTKEGSSYEGNVQNLLSLLRTGERNRLKYLINKLAESRYQSFEKSLNCIGSRIPTQSMQSFMPLNIVGFTDNNINKVFVPKSQTWLQGSDYDIDKLFILMYSLMSNGTLATYSNLKDNFNIEDVLSLPIPTGDTYEQVDPTNKVVDGLFNKYEEANIQATSHEEAPLHTLNDLINYRLYKRNGKLIISLESNKYKDAYIELEEDEDNTWRFYSKNINKLEKIDSNILNELLSEFSETIPLGYKLKRVNNGDLDDKDNEFEWTEKLQNLGFDWVLEMEDSYFVKKQYVNVPTIIDGNIDINSIKQILKSGKRQFYINNVAVPGTNNYFLSNRSLTEEVIRRLDKIIYANSYDKQSALLEFLKQDLKNTEYASKIGRILTENVLNEVKDILSLDLKDVYVKYDILKNRIIKENQKTNLNEYRKNIRISSKLEHLLNKHSKSLSRIDTKRKEASLKNKVVDNAYKVVSNIVNQSNEMNPINMDVQRRAANQSILSNDEQYLTLSSPMLKMVAQIANMVGKDVIGISAVIMKNFFGASFFINERLQQILEDLKQKKYKEAVDKIQTIVFQRDFNIGDYKSSLCTLANINFRPILKYIRENNLELISAPKNEIKIDDKVNAINNYFIDNNTFNIEKIFTDLQTVADNIDAADSISGLLSAATDNAKELILARINATPEFADIYGFLLMSGVDFETIAKFMMSPIMNTLVRFAKQNAFDPIVENADVQHAADFLLGDDNLSYINSLGFNNLLKAWAWENNSNEESRKFSNNSFIPKLIYKIKEDGTLDLDSKGRPIKRTTPIKILIKNPEGSISSYKTIILNEKYLNTFFEIGEDHHLTKKAKEAQDEVLKLLFNDEVVEILQKHLLYLRSKTEKTKSRKGKGFSQLYSELDIDIYEEIENNNYEEFGRFDDENEENLDNSEDYIYDNDNDDFENSEIPKKKVYTDPTYFDGEKRTVQQYTDLLRYTELFIKKRNRLLNQETGDFESKHKVINDLDYIRILKNHILTATRELNILGSMLGANQGFETNPQGLYNYISNIETFINRRYREYNNSLPSDEGILKEFNLKNFINNEEERKEQIEQYSKVKSFINILDCISSIPHFKAMFDMVTIADDATDCSSKVRFTKALISETLSDKIYKADKTQFKIVSNYVDQVFNLNWILKQGFKFKIHENDIYYPHYVNSTKKEAVKHGENFEITIGESKEFLANDMASFRLWMHKSVIEVLKRHPALKSNKFLQALNRNDIQNENHQMMSVYKFNFNPSKVEEHPSLNELWKSITKDFNEIAGDKLSKYGIDSNYTILDVFFMYNLINFGDKLKPASLNKVFENKNLNTEDTLIDDYSQWLSEMDNELEGGFSLSDLQFNIEDLYNLLSETSSARYKFGVKRKNKKNGDLEGIIITTKDKNGENKEGKLIPVNKVPSSDFSFNLPIQLGFIKNEKDFSKHSIKEGREETSHLVRFKLNSRYALNSIIDNLKELFPKIKIITFDKDNYEEQLAKVPIKVQELDTILNSNSFIYNGVIYVNLDKADIGAPFHEYMHIAAGMLKFNENKNIRDCYYRLLESAQDLFQTQYIHEYNKFKEAYKDLNGSDFQEEMLVHLLERAFVEKVEQSWGAAQYDLDFMSKALSSAVTAGYELQGDTINIDKLTTSSIDDLLRYFNSSLFDFNKSGIGLDKVVLNEKLQAIKQKLLESELVTFNNCK